MKKSSFAISADVVTEVLQAVGAIAILTAVMMLIGRSVLGEAVIAMLYLLAVGWLTSRAGRLPGLSAALAAALMFDFLFIPPFLTFSVGSVEGWLMLVIFVLVAVLLVDRIQAGLAQARAREHEALLLYEVSMALVGRNSRRDIAATVAERLQQLYQAAQVQVTLLAEGETPGSEAAGEAAGEAAITARVPDQTAPAARPDYVIPLLAARCLIGEIRVWRGEGVVMANAERLLQSLAGQITLALERMTPVLNSSDR
jgi:two-component system, OmpR family, sensor histidine kinase KdpD